MVTREEQKKEAVERMKAFGIYSGVIKQFEEDDLVNCTEGGMGACFFVNEEQKKAIADYEERTGSLVYHVIKSYMRPAPNEIFCVWSMLYVSAHKEEWSLDRGDLKQGETIAYVYNVTAPDLSEAGAIGITLSPSGGVWRTW